LTKFSYTIPLAGRLASHCSLAEHVPIQSHSQLHLAQVAILQHTEIHNCCSLIVSQEREQKEVPVVAAVDNDQNPGRAACNDLPAFRCLGSSIISALDSMIPIFSTIIILQN